MKKMKLFSLVLVLLFAFTVLTGCSSDDGGAAEGGADTTLLIGGIGPVTGDYANYGTSVSQGAMLAVEEINAAGGVNGFTFELNFQDSQGAPDSAVSAYGLLMDEGMDLSMGATFSGEMASVSAAAAADGILLLTPSASSVDAIAGNDAAYRLCINDPAQGTASANYMAENALGTTAAVFYASDNDYSVGLYETFVAGCAEVGIEVVEVQAFTESGNTDFSAQINSIADSGAEIVFLPIYAAEASTFLTQADGILDDVIFFGCDGLDGLLSQVADPALAEGVMMLTPFSADAEVEAVANFASAYETKYGSAPDQFAANGYDVIYTFKALLEHTGVTPETKDDTFNETMVAAMTEVTVTGVTGEMTWTADGETQKDALAMVIKDGVSTLYTGE